jgi:hypothetical protein
VTRRLLADPARMIDDAEEYDVWAAAQPQEQQAPLLEADAGAAREAGPVECLGLVFASDDDRRAYFLDLLAAKLQDPEFRAIEGFPIGTDADILALSDPPYYTACPNPFIEDFIRHYGKPYDPNVPYHREPFAADVSEGKTDPLYTAHAYHTKVPHKAIMHYILHYTEPGDVVFDGFCGTGMTGVAAQLCGDRASVEALGYRADKDGAILQQESGEGNRTIWRPFSKLGARRALLNDLSPAATFIAYNYNTPVDARTFGLEARRILRDMRDEIGWMYETLHSDGKTKGSINYTVWSDVFACNECGKEIVFVHEALDGETGAIRDTFPCPHCGAISSKNSLTLIYQTISDPAIGNAISIPRRIPVLINYTVNGNKHEKEPDSDDLGVLNQVAKLGFPAGVPTMELPDMQMRRVGRMQSARITHSHHFYLPRAIHALGFMWAKASSCDDMRLRNMLLFLVEQAISGLSLLRLDFAP